MKTSVMVRLSIDLKTGVTLMLGSNQMGFSDSSQFNIFPEIALFVVQEPLEKLKVGRILFKGLLVLLRYFLIL